MRKVPVTAHEVTEGGVSAIEVADRFATVRTNPFTQAPEALGVVGRDYTPLQNEAHCGFLNTLADQSGAVFDTAGSLRGGRQVFVTMRLPESLQIGGSDEVNVNIAGEERSGRARGHAAPPVARRGDRQPHPGDRVGRLPGGHGVHRPLRPGEDPRGRRRRPCAAVADDRGAEQGQGAGVEAPRADRLRSGWGRGRGAVLPPSLIVVGG